MWAVGGLAGRRCLPIDIACQRPFCLPAVATRPGLLKDSPRRIRSLLLVACSKAAICARVVWQTVQWNRGAAMSQPLASSSEWLQALVEGDDRTVAEFWELYGDRLNRLAQRNLSPRLNRRVGADDV